MIFINFVTVQLSHYLDLVEVQIARQISLRSEAFFQAMTSHDHLQSRIGNTCKAIQKLRFLPLYLTHRKIIALLMLSAFNYGTLNCCQDILDT